MRMISVPYLSQFDESVPAQWRERACSITNLAMVLRYFSLENDVTIEALIREGESIEGAFGSRGWTHESIVRLARNHGVSAYAQEFKSRDEGITERFFHEGVGKIRQQTNAGVPVMVSIKKDNGSFHTVTIIHTNGTSVVYHDPEVGPSQMVSVEEFAKIWRRLAIFFETEA